jgi:hypothetical protein
LPSIDSPLAGRRSISWKPKPGRAADPPLFAEAPTAEARAAREAAVTAIGNAAGVSVAEACALYQRAVPIVAKADRRDVRAIRTAVSLANCADLLNSLAVAGATVRRVARQQRDELAAEVAKELVKSPHSDLRAAVSAVLQNPTHEDD